MQICVPVPGRTISLTQDDCQYRTKVTYVTTGDEVAALGDGLAVAMP